MPEEFFIGGKDFNCMKTFLSSIRNVCIYNNDIEVNIYLYLYMYVSSNLSNGINNNSICLYVTKRRDYASGPQ